MFGVDPIQQFEGLGLTRRADNGARAEHLYVDQALRAWAAPTGYRDVTGFAPLG